MTEYLYNSQGKPIAFRVGRDIHNMQGDWIGYFPWDDADAATERGDYLGTLVDDEFLYEIDHVDRDDPGMTARPGDIGAPGDPGERGTAGLRDGYRDIDPSQLTR